MLKLKIVRDKQVGNKKDILKDELFSILLLLVEFSKWMLVLGMAVFSYILIVTILHSFNVI